LLLQIQLNSALHSDPSKIDDFSENALWLHMSSGIVSCHRSSHQISPFHGGNQTTKTTPDAGHNL
jgi:hypothetical protein